MSPIGVHIHMPEARLSQTQMRKHEVNTGPQMAFVPGLMLVPYHLGREGRCSVTIEVEFVFDDL
jgi:hypothetical protein